MRYASSFAVTLPLAAALLLGAGCLTSLQVGQDGQGGGGTGSGGGPPSVDPPTGASCKDPGALLCPWGKIAGPCGGKRPNKKDCDAASGWVCMGGSADVEGTCNVPGQPLVGPGDACGAGVPSTPMCPWNYECNAPIAPDGVGVCVPRNCELGDGSPLVSAASLTVDGDGPTQHYDFACSLAWGHTLTGEANAFAWDPGAAGSKDWLELDGCQSSDGDPYLGSITITAPITGVGTVAQGQVSYYPSGDRGNYLSDPDSVVTFTVTEMTAERVRGTFSTLVSNGPNGSAQLHLTGSFDACRLPAPPPPG